MITIIDSPSAVSLQGEPFLWRVQSSLTVANLRILAEAVNDQYDVARVNNPLDEVLFELRDYYKSELSSVLNYGAVALHNNVCKDFSISFFEYYGTPAQLGSGTIETRKILMGKIPRWKQFWFTQSGYNGIEGWLVVGNHIWLTWYPEQAKKVLPDQPEVIYFIARGAKTYNLSISIAYSDGTTLVHDPGIAIATAMYQVASIPVGYNKLGIGAVDPNKTVVSYTISFDGNTFPRTYVVDFKSYRDVKYIIFRNTLGGYDVLACTGEADETTEIERDISERVYDMANPIRLNKTVYRIQNTAITKVNTGWLQPNEKEWLNDLFESEEVYELVGAYKQPIMLRNTSFDRSQRSYEPGSVELEYEKLYITA
jgi:hypothetical protein